MIDNLQIHFLEQLQLALTFALHGQVDTCVNICLELRLRPEVDLHTRAMINLTLADLLDIETHPDKIKFAQEALRLGRELLVSFTSRSVEAHHHVQSEEILMDITFTETFDQTHEARPKQEL